MLFYLGSFLAQLPLFISHGTSFRVNNYLHKKMYHKKLKTAENSKRLNIFYPNALCILTLEQHNNLFWIILTRRCINEYQQQNLWGCTQFVIVFRIFNILYRRNCSIILIPSASYNYLQHFSRQFSYFFNQPHIFWIGFQFLIF